VLFAREWREGAGVVRGKHRPRPLRGLVLGGSSSATRARVCGGINAVLPARPWVPARAARIDASLRAIRRLRWFKPPDIRPARGPMRGPFPARLKAARCLVLPSAGRVEWCLPEQRGPCGVRRLFALSAAQKKPKIPALARSLPGAHRTSRSVVQPNEFYSTPTAQNQRVAPRFNDSTSQTRPRGKTLPRFVLGLRTRSGSSGTGLSALPLRGPLRGPASPPLLLRPRTPLGRVFPRDLPRSRAARSFPYPLRLSSVALYRDRIGIRFADRCFLVLRGDESSPPAPPYPLLCVPAAQCAARPRVLRRAPRALCGRALLFRAPHAARAEHKKREKPLVFQGFCAIIQ
jgi:hypothetical protein